MSDFIFKSLLATRDRGVMHLTLNRPEARNAMNPQMLAELEIAIDAVRADRELRAIVLLAAGGHFCSGADLKSLIAAVIKAPAPGLFDSVAVLYLSFGSFLRMFACSPLYFVFVHFFTPFTF